MRAKSSKQIDRKKNADHPQFAFRTFNPQHKQHLDKLIEDALIRLNQALKPNEKPRTKSQVISDALERGLGAMVSEASKRKREA